MNRRIPLLFAALLCARPALALAQDEAAAGSEQIPATATGPTHASAAPEPYAESIAVPDYEAAEVDPSAISEQSRPAQLDDIVVTATKRATPTRKIPATLSVLSGEDLEREGVQGIEQIVALVPGVNLADDGQGQAKRITIRGISADTNVNFTTGTLFGDVPFSDPYIPKVQLDPNPFDMATVEILKGPQGTLFGGSGLNGMIRYVPTAPEFDGTHVKYFAQLNSFPGNGDSGWSYGAVLNTPFANDSAALRLLGFRRDAPGFIDDTQSGKDDVNSTEQYGYRAMLTWLPVFDWKVSLMAVGQHTLQDDVAFTSNLDGRLERSNTPRPSPTETDYTLASVGIEHSFSWADFVSQTAAFEKEWNASLDSARIVPGGQVPVLTVVGYNQSESFSQEFRLSSPAEADSPWRWLAGAVYYNARLFDCAEALLETTGIVGLPGLLDLGPLLQSALLQPLSGIVATPCRQNADHARGRLDIGNLVGDIELEEQALFGEISRELGEHWEVTLGTRLYRTQSEGTVTNAGALYLPQTASQGGNGRRDAAIKEQGVSPKASIVFDTTTGFRSYLTVSRGFRFGGIQVGSSTLTTQVPGFFESDSLWNYELGVRTDWFDRSLTIDASIYYIDWTNPQVYQTSADSLASFIDNVGGAQGCGADLSLRYFLPFVDGLSLSASASWNRTETTEVFESSTGASVPAGSKWPLAPEWQTSASLSYMLPLASWRSAISLRHSYTGTACNVIECSYPVFGYRTLDLNLSLASLLHASWPELSVSLSNLGDERGIGNVASSTLLGEAVSYIPPRSLVVRISGSF
ncbi:MAG: TonB-dependent receptor [Pseudomonadota bacterium]|nr:TonB-dependent receptor [Pseudomonadota bacterium]